MHIMYYYRNMKKMKSIFFLLLSWVIVFLAFSPMTTKVYAAQYDLVAPTGQLARGQNVQFTVNIDTQGQSLTSTTIGMKYDSTLLQYVSTTRGNAFPTVQTDTSTAGQLLFNASNTNGFSGTGTFAIVTFQIIATSSGSTELCVLFAPSGTPAPTAPVPTALPKTGSIIQTGKGAAIGTLFLLAAATGLVFYNKKTYRTPKSTHSRQSP